MLFIMCISKLPLPHKLPFFVGLCHLKFMNTIYILITLFPRGMWHGTLLVSPPLHQYKKPFVFPNHFFHAITSTASPGPTTLTHYQKQEQHIPPRVMGRHQAADELIHTILNIY